MRNRNRYRFIMMTAVCILAGGGGGRMGGGKHRKRLLGKRLIDHALDIAGDVLKDTGWGPIVVSSGNTIPRIDGVEILLDEGGAGPMAGLYSSLVNRGRTLIFPCDMPFLHPGLLVFLMEESRGMDVTVCRIRGFVQPQVGVYSERCIPRIEKLIRNKTYSLFRLIERDDLRVRIIEDDEISRFGDPEIMYVNINTPAELDEAEEKMREYRKGRRRWVEDGRLP